MLLYAKQKNSNRLLHISKVDNGLACNCVCPECGSQLVAKNGGKTDRNHHFSHHNGVESLGCFMTQLHLVAQDYFLNLKLFELPEVNFQYKGTDLFHPKTKVQVKSAQLEAKIGPYFADVLLETELVTIAIEVFVTHRNDNDKIGFYRQNKFSSIEFDLSSYLDRKIGDALADLKENKVPFEWLYEWCRERLIIEHEQKLAKKAEELRLHRIRSAKDAAERIEKVKKIRLPKLEHEFIYQTGGHSFSESMVVSKEGLCVFSSIKRIEDAERYIHLKGIRNCDSISLLLLFINTVPDSVDELEENVIVRLTPDSIYEQATWRWHRHSKLDRKIEEQQRLFEVECQIGISKIPVTRDAEREALRLSEQFTSRSEELFKKGYGKWKRWLVDAGIQYQKNDKGNPKIPSNLKYARIYPCLWVFNLWPIFVLSVLAEIIDEKPFGKVISYKELFAELSGSFPLHPRFLEMEQEISSKMVNPNFKDLLLREEIIRDALRPFEFSNAISLRESGVMRRRYLLECFNGR